MISVIPVNGGFERVNINKGFNDCSEWGKTIECHRSQNKTKT